MTKLGLFEKKNLNFFQFIENGAKASGGTHCALPPLASGGDRFRPQWCRRQGGGTHCARYGVWDEDSVKMHENAQKCTPGYIFVHFHAFLHYPHPRHHSGHNVSPPPADGTIEGGICPPLMLMGGEHNVSPLML